MTTPEDPMCPSRLYMYNMFVIYSRLGGKGHGPGVPALA